MESEMSKKPVNAGGELPEIASIIAMRLQDIADRKSQNEVAEEVGFVSKNVLSIMKGGKLKLSLDRVEAMAKALEMDTRSLMMPALRQYYSDDVINTLREVFAEEDTKAERELVNLARKYMDTSANLSHETREALKEIFAKNKPAGA